MGADDRSKGVGWQTQRQKGWLGRSRERSAILRVWKARCEEDEKMDEEVNRKKKLGKRKKDLQKQLRNFEKFTDVPLDIQNVLKETWQQELQHF